MPLPQHDREKVPELILKGLEHSRENGQLLKIPFVFQQAVLLLGWQSQPETNKLLKKLTSQPSYK